MPCLGPKVGHKKVLLDSNDKPVELNIESR